MHIEETGIPNIGIKKIGTKKNYIHNISGFIDLPCWTGYFLEENVKNTLLDKIVRDGQIRLSISPYKDPDGSLQVGEEQVAAYHHLVEHQQKVQQTILNRLREDFPRLLEDDYQYYDHEEGGFPMRSELTPGFDFINYIGPGSVTICEEAKEGIAYILWHFNCRWDPEHGFEVITHKDRVIALSPDVDMDAMYKDNGTYEQYEAEYGSRVVTPPKRKKKWWQFWN